MDLVHVWQEAARPLQVRAVRRPSTRPRSRWAGYWPAPLTACYCCLWLPWQVVLDKFFCFDSMLLLPMIALVRRHSPRQRSRWAWPAPLSACFQLLLPIIAWQVLLDKFFVHPYLGLSPKKYHQRWRKHRAINCWLCWHCWHCWNGVHCRHGLHCRIVG